MTVQSLTAGHVVAILHGTWGHVRPLLHLCVNLLITHPKLRVTLLVTPEGSPRIIKELGGVELQHVHSAGSKGEAPLIQRLQIVNVSLPGPAPPQAANSVLPVAVEINDALVACLLGGKSMMSGQVSNLFPDIPAKLVIFDLFLAFVPPMVRETAQRLQIVVPNIIAFTPSPAASAFHWFPNGGLFDLIREHVQHDIADGVDENQAWTKNAFYTDGRVIDIPGLPKKFDYEYFPQIGNFDVPPFIAKMIVGFLDAFRDPDVAALLVPTVEELEPITKAAVEKSTGKPLLMAGLQHSEGAWDGYVPSRDSLIAEDKEVLDFLDRMLAERGPRQVAYVSFGSLFFPQHRPELVLWLLDSLIEASIPFVFAHACEILEIPSNIIERAKSNPLGKAIKFAPQWHILHHEATGFFVSHCGSNSTAEAILSGVPIVSFPFAADQGEYVALLEHHGVAIDLKQVKTFRNPEWKTLMDGGEVIGTEKAVKDEMREVFRTVMGPTGDELRARMAIARKQARKSRDEGNAREVMEGLKTYF